MESFLIWIPLPKTQRRVKTLRYRPCDDTPNAATVSLTTGRVALLSSKKSVYYFILHREVYGHSETLLVVIACLAYLLDLVDNERHKSH
jgi:hypothetical protein